MKTAGLMGQIVLNDYGPDARCEEQSPSYPAWVGGCERKIKLAGYGIYTSPILPFHKMSVQEFYQKARRQKMSILCAPRKSGLGSLFCRRNLEAGEWRILSVG